MSILGTCPECKHHNDGMCDLRPRICLNYDHFERRSMVTLTRDDFEKLYISRAAYDELNAKVAALEAANARAEAAEARAKKAKDFIGHIMMLGLLRGSPRLTTRALEILDGFEASDIEDSVTRD